MADQVITIEDGFQFVFSKLAQKQPGSDTEVVAATDWTKTLDNLRPLGFAYGRPGGVTPIEYGDGIIANGYIKENLRYPIALLARNVHRIDTQGRAFMATHCIAVPEAQIKKLDYNLAWLLLFNSLPAPEREYPSAATLGTFQVEIAPEDISEARQARVIDDLLTAMPHPDLFFDCLRVLYADDDQRIPICFVRHDNQYIAPMCVALSIAMSPERRRRLSFMTVYTKNAKRQGRISFSKGPAWAIPPRALVANWQTGQLSQPDDLEISERLNERIEDLKHDFAVRNAEAIFEFVATIEDYLAPPLVPEEPEPEIEEETPDYPDFSFDKSSVPIDRTKFAHLGGGATTSITPGWTPESFKDKDEPARHRPYSRPAGERTPSAGAPEFIDWQPEKKPYPEPEGRQDYTFDPATDRPDGKHIRPQDYDVKHIFDYIENVDLNVDSNRVDFLDIWKESKARRNADWSRVFEALLAKRAHRVISLLFTEELGSETPGIYGIVYFTEFLKGGEYYPNFEGELDGHELLNLLVRRRLVLPYIERTRHICDVLVFEENDIDKLYDFRESYLLNRDQSITKFTKCLLDHREAGIREDLMTRPPKDWKATIIEATGLWLRLLYYTGMGLGADQQVLIVDQTIKRHWYFDFDRTNFSADDFIEGVKLLQREIDRQLVDAAIGAFKARLANPI